MNTVTIRLSESQYSIMQAHAAYYLKWCYGHFKHKKSQGIQPEIILAAMHGKYFDKKVSELRFPNSGKAFHLQYFEAKAYLECTCVVDDLPTKTLNKMIEADLEFWKISFTKPTMREWYDSKDELTEIYGNYDEMGDFEFEVINELYNQVEL
jgi:hypothetical protein